MKRPFREGEPLFPEGELPLYGLRKIHAVSKDIFVIEINFFVIAKVCGFIVAFSLIWLQNLCVAYLLYT
jgi:hypothetical protein